MRIISFNANGIRSAAGKGFFDWLKEQKADVTCIQETKAQEDQLGDDVFRMSGHYRYFKDAATKKGYSGVAIYARSEPDEVITALGWHPFDDEGRYIEARFGRLSVVSLYLPSGSSAEHRQAFKFEVMAWFRPILDRWLRSDRDYVLCGDWNIVRSERDIRNWKSNQKTSGCLPAEREWMNALCAGQTQSKEGWVDAYRELHPEGQSYTWWSSRGAARAKDVGWRIDYQLASPTLRARLKSCAIERERQFSDHAPFVVDYAGALRE